MLDRYAIYDLTESENDWNIKIPKEYISSYNCFPSKKLPIIIDGDAPIITIFHWGLMSSWSNDKPMSKRLFNTNYNDLISKRSLRSSFNSRRCLIPMNGFFLWKPISKKKQIPYYFHSPNQKLFYVPGIWEENDEFSNTDSNSFMIALKGSSNSMKEFQSEVPIILDRDSGEVWLKQGEIDLSYFDNNKLENSLSFHSVTPRIQNSDENSANLIEAVKPADQLGNYTLFG